MTLLAPQQAQPTSPLTSHEELAVLLVEARVRTLLLIESLTDDDVARQHDPLMSPILWDLGHIAGFEALWLGQNLDGPIEFGEMPGLYDPFAHPRRERGALPLPGRADILAALAAIRERTLERVGTLALDGPSPLLRDGYVVHMVAQHEYQHNETMLQALQLKQGAPYRAPRTSAQAAAATALPAGMVSVPGGVYPLGTDDRASAYDNERPRHAQALAPFAIDVAPVSNGDYLAFIDDGGYRTRRWWSEAGWTWRDAAGAEAPMYWTRAESGWRTRSMDRVHDVEPAHPVCHVSWYEAEAYSRWAGKRLPTEAEWEVAASWDPAAHRARRFPWGERPPTAADANVDQLRFGTAPIGSYAGNLSPLGCSGMIGDVWEWTSSELTAYPGFEAFPYPEYSAVFFGVEYKVLRGGSWATRPGAIRNTFRNWDYPIRRQIFSGFRCARDE